MPHESRHILLFANPISGRGAGKRIADQLIHLLGKEDFHVTTLFDSPQSLPDTAIDLSSRAAIAVGGDGTLRAVAARLYRAAASRAQKTMPPLAIVPTGTANLMARHLGLRKNDRDRARRLVAGIRTPRIVRFDAALGNGRLFLLMAGIGFDAATVHALQQRRTGPIYRGSYALPIVRTLRDYDFPPLQVTADGREIFAAAPALAFVGNVAEYGAGFPMLPYADPFDGYLDVCVMPASSRRDLVRLALHAAAGQHVKEEGVVYARARRVRITSPRAVPLQLDGDAEGTTPVEIQVLPGAIPFLLPGD